MEEVQWTVDTLIGGEADDTTLLLPGFIASRGGRLLVYDYGDARLKVFDRDGTWLWSFGRFGEGPGEFSNPADAIVGADGLLWVLDEGAGRITRISPNGELVDIINLLAPAWRLLPTDDQVLVFPANASDVFYWSFLPSGVSDGSMEYPLERLQAADPRLRFVEVGASRMGGWGAAFAKADLFLSYQDNELRCMGVLTVRAPIDRQWSPADNLFDPVLGVGWQGDWFEVFSLALPDSKQVFIDRYRADNCEYEASMLLSVPVVVASVVPDGDSYYILSRDPVPAVYEARRQPS